MQVKIKKDRFYIVLMILIGIGALFASAHFVGGMPWSLNAPILAIKMYGIHMPKQLIIAYAVSVLFVPISIALNPFKERNEMYGSSHFATEKEIKEMGLRKQAGMIIGKSRGKYLRVSDPLSVLVFAPPGTGKTAAIVIPTLLASDYSTVTFDPKGELLEKTGPWRSQFSTLQKFAPGEEDSMSWNPLAKEELPETWPDIEVHINRVAECLLPVPASGDAHWMTEARRIFIFWSLYLIHHNGETSFKEVLTNALSSEPQVDVETCLLEENLPENVVLQGNAIVSKADKEFSGVLSSFSNALNIFLDPRVAKNTTKSEIRLSQLRKERTSIYLVVSNQDSVRLKPILTLFFEMTANFGLSKEPEPHEMGILLCMDEFVRLGKMDEIKRTPAIGRSYRLVCLFVVQTLAQLASIYGQEGAKEFMGTCSYQVFFTQNEPSTAQMLSQAIGFKTVETKSKSGRAFEQKSTSAGHTGLPLIRGEEILSLPFGDILILRQSNYNKPVKAKGAYWFKESFLKKCVAFKPSETTIENESKPDQAEALVEKESGIEDVAALNMAVTSAAPEIEEAEIQTPIQEAVSPEETSTETEDHTEEDPFEGAFGDESGWSDEDLNDELRP